MGVGVRDSVCDCNGRAVHRCVLRKRDWSGGSDIGFLGRNLGRAPGKVVLPTHPGEADYGCSGEKRIVEVGTCKDYLLGTEHHTEILREEVWQVLDRRAQAAAVDTSAVYLWARLPPAWAWLSAPFWDEAQGGVSETSQVYPKSLVVTQEHSD